MPRDRRGLGLALVQELTERLTIEGTDTGTTVHAEIRTSKSPHSRGSHEPSARPELFDAYVADTPDGATLAIIGRADIGALDEISDHLAICTTAGAKPLTIDLDLAPPSPAPSSGTVVRHIRQALDTAEAPVCRAGSAARPGTPAHQVLTIAGVPHAP